MHCCLHLRCGLRPVMNSLMAWIDLGKVTVLVLLLGAAVCPVVQTKPHSYTCQTPASLMNRKIAYITHGCPLPQPQHYHSSARATSGCSRSRSPEKHKSVTLQQCQTGLTRAISTVIQAGPKYKTVRVMYLRQQKRFP